MEEKIKTRIVYIYVLNSVDPFLEFTKCWGVKESVPDWEEIASRGPALDELSEEAEYLCRKYLDGMDFCWSSYSMDIPISWAHPRTVILSDPKQDGCVYLYSRDELSFLDDMCLEKKTIEIKETKETRVL